MSLPISTLQSLISRNRAAINRAHKYVDFWKAEAKDEVSLGYSDLTPEYCYQAVSKQTEEIAKLAIIQKQLKRELAYALSMQRAENLVLNGWLKPHLDAAKRNAEAKGLAAKEAAMLHQGEFY